MQLSLVRTAVKRAPLAIGITCYSTIASTIFSQGLTTSKTIQTTPVEPPTPLLIDPETSPQRFTEYLRQSRPKPFVLPAASTTNARRLHQNNAQSILAALRQGESLPVDIELGRYDDTRPGRFDQVTMPLGHYLDWLENNQSGTGTIGGRQVYLAQWRALDETPGLTGYLDPPMLLQPLINKHAADLYQSSFFLGPTGAVTPLHHDPYENLFHLQASSKPREFAKHFLLLPPHLSPFLERSDLRSGQRNTSPIDFQLQRRNTNNSPDAYHNFDILTDYKMSDEVVEAMSTSALSCVLFEGDTLFIPRGWWHRVENVAVQPSDSSHKHDPHVGWTAGIGWWFLLRSHVHNFSRGARDRSNTGRVD